MSCDFAQPYATGNCSGRVHDRESDGEAAQPAISAGWRSVIHPYVLVRTRIEGGSHVSRFR
jgi:hypothetical protein